VAAVRAVLGLLLVREGKGEKGKNRAPFSIPVRSPGLIEKKKVQKKASIHRAAIRRAHPSGAVGGGRWGRTGARWPSWIGLIAFALHLVLGKKEEEKGRTPRCRAVAVFAVMAAGRGDAGLIEGGGGEEKGEKEKRRKENTLRKRASLNPLR